MLARQEVIASGKLVITLGIFHYMVLCLANNSVVVHFVDSVKNYFFLGERAIWVCLKLFD